MHLARWALRKALIVVSLLPILPMTVARGQAIRYVDPDATGTPEDGTSWGQAYLTLEGGLTDPAVGQQKVELRVKEQTYIPNGTLK